MQTRCALDHWDTIWSEFNDKITPAEQFLRRYCYQERATMQLRLISVLLVVLTRLVILNAQDLDATATVIAGATETAIVAATHAIELETEDPYALTATALVLAATQTAAVSTALPIKVEAQSETNDLTPTELVPNATLNAVEGTPPPFGTGPSSEDANIFALSATFFIFAALILALVGLGALFIYWGRRGGTGKQG